MTTVLKLGGSVITHKDDPDTVDEGTLERVATAIGSATDGNGGLVLVHGGGSFGHHHAARHGVSATEGSHDAQAVTDIHEAMTDLNQAVVATLQENRVPALPVRPLSLAHRKEHQELSMPPSTVAAMLEEGFVPVLHGDVIVEKSAGGTILSGDEIVVSLARSLSADRVGLCSTVPGVLDGNDEVIDTIESYDDVEEVIGGSEATDVTGGMAGKVRELLGLEVPAHIFEPEGLPAFLDGDSPGTVILGEAD
jgi:isopentenyl phosphate kinase